MYQLSENVKITPELAVKYIKRHNRSKDRLDELYSYYMGQHRILSRTKEKGAANNRLICNHAKYITDCTTGYFMGTPVQYLSRDGKDISAVKNVLRRADSATEDVDLARLSSVFGTSYEMLYFSGDKNPRIKLTAIDPRNAFVVYDDTVEQKPLFGVYYMPAYDENDLVKGYRCYLCGRDSVTEFVLSPSLSIESKNQPYPHYFGDVPLIEFYNNGDCQGDFEQVISLIDAYNLLQSDRVNDKEQFVNAILLIKGNILGDTSAEESETYRAIKEFGVMTINDDGDAKWLTRQFDESSVDILRKALENDIHKFSGVPCMNDASFSGNASGVAMKYKLLAFEQMTKIKERYFTEGIRLRLKMIANAVFTLTAVKTDPDDIELFFTHVLPQNETELAQTANLLRNIVPNDKLLKLLNFIPDTE